MDTKSLPGFFMVISCFFVLGTLVYIYLPDLLKEDEEELELVEGIYPDSVHESVSALDEDSFEFEPEEKKDGWLVRPSKYYLDECLSEYKPFTGPGKLRSSDKKIYDGYIQEIDVSSGKVILKDGSYVFIRSFDFEFLEVRRLQKENGTALNSFNLLEFFSAPQILEILDPGDYIEISVDKTDNGLVKLTCYGEPL
ncbi:hypothetical protein JXA34_02995 [Patescibacteria group bacterium]|nr:hypothetical protein [Patescibacteria group bacterium]